VGSVNSPSKNRSSFSSVGLSVDGRIKPDVMAMGSNNYIAAPNGSTGYTFGSGTSFSCPMTAGACAVILSANPNLTPREVWKVLTQTADSAFAPNRLRGWGLINTWNAVKLGKQKTLNLTALIEGFYNVSTNSMVPDTVTLNLRNAVSPYALIESAKRNLSSTGNAVFTYNTASNGTGYYLQVLHRSAIETWSKTPQSFVNFIMNYNFTTDSAKAFGNNLNHEGTKWVIFGGDVNNSGDVDLSDITLTYDDALTFSSGYIDTDLNGDNVADLSDLLIVFNNSANFVQTVKP
jgi:hypothetical protein